MASIKSAIRRLNRAFQAKDERAFDDAMDEFEEKMGEGKDDSPEEEAIEIHNHIPGADGLGELPPKDPANDRRARDEEMPPWFKEHAEATDAKFKKMNDSLSKLTGKNNDNEEDPDEEEVIEDDENLDMDSRDEPSEREEMAERIKKNGGDKGKDEANKAILGELEFEAPPGTGDRAMRAKDSRYLEEAFQDAVAKAEVLSPGIRVPTFDKAAPPIKTARAIFALRRTALDLANGVAVSRGVIDQALSGRALDAKIGYGQQRVLFNAVAGAMATRNNNRATDRGGDFGGGNNRTEAPRIQSVADINKVNREKYAVRK